MIGLVSREWIPKKPVLAKNAQSCQGKSLHHLVAGSVGQLSVGRHGDGNTGIVVCVPGKPTFHLLAISNPTDNLRALPSPCEIEKGFGIESTHEESSQKPIGWERPAAASGRRGAPNPTH